MAEKRILLTGSTGFSGRFVLKRLIADGNHVFAIVRNKEKLVKIVGQDFIEQSNLDVIERQHPEKSNVENLRILIEKNQITTVVHLAAIAREFSEINWETYFETNVLWTKNLALAFCNANVNHNKFLFISTVGVYGTIPNRIPADEETVYDPDGNYHKSKKLAELQLLKLKTDFNLPLLIIRPSIMYGFDDFGFLYKLFKLSKKKRYPLSSNNPHFHLLDVELFAEVCTKITDLTSFNHFIFNVSDRKSITAKELLDGIKKQGDFGYFTIKSMFFSFLKLFFRFSPKRLITLKLISESWSYSTDRLFELMKLNSNGIIHNLEHKYWTWYCEE